MKQKIHIRKNVDFLWLGWPDSDRRMPESKSGALPLGYTPIALYYTILFRCCQVDFFHFFKKSQKNQSVVQKSGKTPFSISKFAERCLLSMLFMRFRAARWLHAVRSLLSVVLRRGSGCQVAVLWSIWNRQLLRLLHMKSLRIRSLLPFLLIV